MNQVAGAEMIPKLMFWILFLHGSIKARGQAATYQLAKPGCQQKCGNIAIPFPFGIGPAGCFLDDWYEVVCSNGTNTPRLKKLDLQVLNITLPEYYGPWGEAMITVNFQSFNVSFRKDEAAFGASEGCSYAALVDRSEFSPSRMHALEQKGYVPAVLQWGVANTTHFGIDLLDYRSPENKYRCTSGSMSGGYTIMPFTQCYCRYGYDGNAYLENGCQVTFETLQYLIVE
ncbi:hypothetical protein CRG98_042342 [Punica granatum]|uniref:Wall-associated receptor kinase galacturonan-binding domain-containing protein n=1 Tax=Punica granatum TaxID=22663 RepID=A0A2I0HZY6_PUNGR|nr:hypothetical protein CRG98_042342 [Punica granatum]